jgi:alpha-mannosidase
MENLEGAPRVRMASPLEYFKDLEQRGTPDDHYVGELYFQAHRGTYTSQARIKRGNRKCELALREAEMWTTAAAALAGTAVPKDRLDEAWVTVLLNQFHDLLPGTSIERVCREVEAGHAEALQAANDVRDEATGTLAEGDDGLTVFNSLSWSRAGLVPLPTGAAGAVDATGDALPTQQMDDCTVAEVRVPPCGWTSITPTDAEPAAAPSALSATDHSMENEFLRLAFNDWGELTSIFDKETGQELATAPCNSMRMYRDIPCSWDAWDIDSVYTLSPVDLPEPATLRLLDNGPLVARLRIERKLNDSSMVQTISLRRGSRRVDFHTVVDWRENHKMLKVSFPVDIHAEEAIHEIQFGHVHRPNHTSRQYDADRFEVSNHRWSALAEENRGFAVLNDCKYGLNVVGNSINLTLLRSPMAPDMTADRGHQEFTYAIYPWNGSLAESNVVREGYELNVPLAAAPGAAEERSLFSVDAGNVVLEAAKPAEDGSGDIVVRLYESKRMRTRATVTTTLPVASATETDMLERHVAGLDCVDGKLELDFRPFEIKTIRLKLQ